MDMSEPDAVYPEVRFAEAIEAEVRECLTESNQSFVMVRGFGLDLAVFIDKQRWVFVEAKSFNRQRQGGVGFGNGRGGGAQVELLLRPEADLRRLDGSVRWAYADATRPSGSSRFGFFTSSEVKRAVMGIVARGKQNNFRVNAFESGLVTWETFCGQLRSFLLEDVTSANPDPQVNAVLHFPSGHAPVAD